MFKVWTVITLAMLIVCSITDIKSHTVDLVVISVPASAYMAYCAYVSRYDGENHMICALIGMIPGVVILLISILGAGIGDGDAYLIMAVGALSGLETAVKSLIYALLTASVYGIYILIKEKEIKGKGFAFVPFIFLGYVLCLLIGILNGKPVLL